MKKRMRTERHHQHQSTVSRKQCSVVVVVVVVKVSVFSGRIKTPGSSSSSSTQQLVCAVHYFLLLDALMRQRSFCSLQRCSSARALVALCFLYCYICPFHLPAPFAWSVCVCVCVLSRQTKTIKNQKRVCVCEEGKKRCTRE